MNATPHVGLRVDADTRIGVGHAVRCLALSQELRARGVPVSLFGRLEVPWVRSGYERAGVTLHDAAELPPPDMTHAVLDGYDLPAALGVGLRERGVRVLAMVDGAFGAHQHADLYVDQNYGGVVDVPKPVPEARCVAGIEYALFRDEVLAARDLSAAVGSNPPRVLVVFGGTDPMHACPEYVGRLVATGAPMHLIAVAASDQHAEQVRAVEFGPQQQIEVLAPPPDLLALAATCDAAVSAAGSTIWELLAVGVPTASVCVIDNQEPGYVTTVRDEIVLPGGRLPQLRSSDDTVREAEASATRHSLARLVDDAHLRARMRTAGRRLVDGWGRARVADLLLQG